MTEWIASDAQLASRFSGLGTSPIALDTEFIREKTFYPQLALVQVEVDGQLSLIDPLSLDSAEALKQMLRGPALKLMHSPSEDLQTFRHSYATLPRPMFDTQLAAALVGLGAGLGYQALILKLLGIHLEKGETRSDWMRRPLSPAQLLYAADDVRHLVQVFELLDAKLRALGRREWLDQDCERQLDAAERDEAEPHPHLGLRPAQRLRADAQARLRLLLLWRERQARHSDKPKSWILDNSLVLELAQSAPATRAAFDAQLDASPRSPRRSRDELWDTLSRAMTPEERDIPLAESPDPRWREPMRRMQQAVVSVATELDLPEGLLCARRHLESLLATRTWPTALEGWRRPLLEARLLPLLDEV